MAYAIANRASGKGISARLAEIVKTAKESAARRRLYVATMQELNALDYRELSDLGISAGDFNRLAREAAYGK